MTRDMEIAWKHAALVLSKKLMIGSAKANEELRHWLDRFGNIDAIYEHHFGLVPVDTEVTKLLDKEFSKVQFEFKSLTYNDELYPEKLRGVAGAPPIIYCRGDLSLLDLKKTISFVGTRELDNPRHIAHGKRVIERLFEAGYEAIVSGLALGSDTLGHSTAIELNKKTIAVLGTPLTLSYPKENRELQEKIAQNHLIVTEYPVGLRSFGSYFANRNRTTVGLSTGGVVVARAGDKSGTQYAIRYSIDQGKPVYVLENNIHEKDYSWVLKYKDHIKIVRE